MKKSKKKTKNGNTVFLLGIDLNNDPDPKITLLRDLRDIKPIWSSNPSLVEETYCMARGYGYRRLVEDDMYDRQTLEENVIIVVFTKEGYILHFAIDKEYME